MTPSIKIEPGVEVIAEGRRYQISRVLDLESVLAYDVETGAVHQFSLTQLLPSPQSMTHRTPQHSIPARSTSRRRTGSRPKHVSR